MYGDRGESVAGQPGKVHRLTFEYEGDQVRLLSDQLVNMVAPPSHSLDETGPVGGFAATLLGAADEALYRVSIPSPITSTVEVFSPDGTISRVPTAARQGTFVLLVPAVDGGLDVELTDHQTAHRWIFHHPDDAPLAGVRIDPPAVVTDEIRGVRAHSDGSVGVLHWSVKRPVQGHRTG